MTKRRYSTPGFVSVLFRLRRLCEAGLISLLLFPSIGSAQRMLTVDIGTKFDLGTIFQRLISFLAASIAAIAVAMFVVGAFMVVLSGAKEDYKQKGKDLIIGSIIGTIVVLGAYALLRTVDYFIAGGS